ncbi:MAG: hypothetical protein ABL997_08795, partial [Planctomycetota bacterium]
ATSAAVTFTLDGTQGDLVVVALGVRGPEQALFSFGGVFLDLLQPTFFATFPTLPVQVSAQLPRNGVPLTAQAVLLTPAFLGTLSNPVDFVL